MALFRHFSKNNTVGSGNYIFRHYTTTPAWRDIYQEVGYIVANGTQGFLSNVYGKWYIKAKFDVTNNLTVDSSFPVLFGSELSSGTVETFGNSFRVYNNDSTTWRTQVAYEYDITNYNINFSTPIEVIASTFNHPTNGHAYYIINGTTYYTTHIISDNNSNNGIMCRYNQSSGGYSSDGWWKGKLYYLKVYSDQGTTLIRDYIPCYRKSDSVIGLYDIVNDVFYTNVGTGTFGKGADVN